MLPFIIIGVVLWVMLAFWPAILAKRKGYSFLLFLILSWGVSFFVTLIVVLILDDKSTNVTGVTNNKEIDNGN